MQTFEGDRIRLVFLNNTPYDFFDSFFQDGVRKLDFDRVKRYFRTPVQDAVFFKAGGDYKFDPKSRIVSLEPIDDLKLPEKLLAMPEWPALNQYLEYVDKWQSIEDVVHPSIVPCVSSYFETSHLKFEILRRRMLNMSYPNTHEILSTFSKLETSDLAADWASLVDSFSGNKQRVDNLLFWQFPMRHKAADIAHQTVFGELIKDAWEVVNKGWTATSELFEFEGDFIHCRFFMGKAGLAKDGKPVMHILLYFPYIRKNWQKAFVLFKEQIFLSVNKGLNKRLK